MEARQAFEKISAYLGEQVRVRTDGQGYFCLNDIAVPFVGKELKDWKKQTSVREMTAVLDKELGYPSTYFVKNGETKGTWAHPTLAVNFLGWLSPEYQLRVFEELLGVDHESQIKNMKAIFEHFGAEIVDEKE